MAIKAGQILHVANQFVVDRIQTGGAGQLNIPQEKVYELGNYQSVGIVRDVPDLTFSLECLNVDTEVEALLVGRTAAQYGADAAGTIYDLSKSKTLDITSPWKTPYGEFNAVNGVAIPGLALESVSYRFGLQENAGETFSLRGDSIFYVPGTPWQQVGAGDGAVTAFAFTHAPLTYKTDQLALSVSINGERQIRLGLTGNTAADAALAQHTASGVQAYTEAAGSGITFALPPASGAVVSIVYGTDVTAVADDWPQSVHQGVSVKPAAVRGRDLDVYFNGVRLRDVQSATADWRVTLEEDREFGNAYAVAREATDVPGVTGAIEVKPRSVDAFFSQLRQITGVADNKVIGPDDSVVGSLEVRLRNPDNGRGGTTSSAVDTVLKTLYAPAVRFTLPGYEGRVQQKLTNTLNWESDDGVLQVIKGPRT